MKQHLESLLHAALEQLLQSNPSISPDTLQISLERPRDPSHGDWSSSIAMVLAKPLKQAPRAIAEQLIGLISLDKHIEAIELAGPGFINFKLTTSYLQEQLEHIWASPNCGIAAIPHPETVVIDYSSPNLAKEMHVGHLRSTIIGDALARILSFQGQTVVRQNHIGDWGTQFGMLIAHLDEIQQGSKDDFNLNDLEGFYQAAKQRFDADPAFADLARAWVVKLQAHEPQSYALWQRFITLSLAHCQSLYQRLGVCLQPQDIHAESAYNDALPTVITTLRSQGLLADQEGTQCVFLEQFIGKDKQPLPIIVQKRDGGYLYATTDLAALAYRHQTLKADRVLYVVDARQSLHFQQIFALAVQAGFVPATMRLEHIDFGMILDKSGKPFRSREGGVTKLVDLLDEAERRAAELIMGKNPSMSVKDCQTMAKIIGIAAVKYADLSKNRMSDYVFDWDTMLSFEGNTAPYLLYANTRIHSLFQKATFKPEHLTQGFQLQVEQELMLGKHLALFPEVIATVAAKATPHLLCTYLYELAGLFSSFYEACPILSADQDSQQSRLKLAALSSKILEQGLHLLGIDTLKRM